MPHLFTLQPLYPWHKPDERPEDRITALSPTLQSALSCTGSLTRHLEESLKQTITVQVINQDEQPDWEQDAPLWSQHHTLPQDNKVMLRNAWLRAGEKKILFAHSQLAINSHHETTRQAIAQGELPLGSLFLQREKPVERQQLELTQATIPALADQLNRDREQLFWCRRSLFLVSGTLFARILEIFLTDLDNTP
ncbi:MAG: chorismate lyase [Magnetococcales bacterium]|nr:chorismate lyase [Magnetococcales bacterium]